jgi:NADH-quinone oxidoreductase subunit F
MMGRTICALSDAAALPAISFVTKFRNEFEYFVNEKKSLVKGNYRIRGLENAQVHH